MATIKANATSYYRTLAEDARHWASETETTDYREAMGRAYNDCGHAVRGGFRDFLDADLVDLPHWA